jgi:hypothetical protein
MIYCTVAHPEYAAVIAASLGVSCTIESLL